jgi:mannosyltransferase OCH1-like enzyme
MYIPFLIHQTWKHECIPEDFEALVCTWRTHHSHWEYRLWTDAENRHFIATQFPEFLPCYDAYREPIQRADAIRYFLLYHFGGVYVDLDVECLRAVDEVLGGASCVIGVEPEVHAQRHDRTKILSNAWMATAPGHPFFKAIIDRLPEFAQRASGKQPVLTSTGPFMLTEVYEDFPAKESVTVLPAKYFNPLTMDQADKWRRSGEMPSGMLDDAYAVHYHVGSWWRKDPVSSSANVSEAP